MAAQKKFGRVLKIALSNVSITSFYIANPLASVEQLYAFFYVPPSPGTGWTVFNHRTEFARQGLGARTKAWRFTDINKDYSFSPTYPSKLVVPSRISDSTLTYAGKYRSKARIPALTYLHWANNVSYRASVLALTC